MERLTYRSPLGNAVSYGACEDVKCKVRDCDKCKVGAMICRLCAYEDTGLEPEEYKKHADAIKKLDIEHMHDLLQAEKDGRLVVLPCEIGDTIFMPVGRYGITGFEEDRCDGFFIGHDGVLQIKAQCYSGNHGTYGVPGETAFLTREEAEAALKKREEA